VAAIAQLKAILGIDNKQYKAGVRDSETATSSFQKKLAGIGRSMGIAFSVGAVIAVGKHLLATAAKLETLRVQFESLGVSAGQAGAHMRDLRKFAAETPFQIADIASASQQLYALSEGVLGGVDSLKLFGDVAATGSKDFAGLAYWVGRLYAALASDQPIMDSMNSLLRLKAIPPSILKEMKDMKEAGATGAEIWDKYTASLDRFRGGMEKLSETLAGRTSTLKDNIDDLAASFGDLFMPLAKGGAVGATKFMQIAKWLSPLHYFEAFAKKIGAETVEGGDAPTFLDYMTGKDQEGKGLPGGLKMKTKKDGKQSDDLRLNEWDIHERDREIELNRIAREKVPADAKDRRVGMAAGFKKELSGYEEMAEAIEAFADQTQSIIDGARGKTGVDSMASVGIFAGPQRNGMMIADRQLKVQMELRRLGEQTVERLDDIRAAMPGGGGL